MDISTETIYAISAALLYFAGLAPLLRSVMSNADWGALPIASRWLTGGALLLHAMTLQEQIVTDSGLLIGVTDAASLFLWQCALLVWLMSYRRPLAYLYISLMPVTAIAVLGPELLQAENNTGSSIRWSIALHIVLSMLAYGLLTIAAIQGAVLALQDRLLKNHERRHWLKQLPPLETMEQTLFLFMGGGFFMLSLALLSGLLFVEDLFAQHLVHKTALSIFAWAVFGTLIWGRWKFGWRGKIAIRWTIGGYSALLLAYFGSKWVLEVVLGTGW